MLLFTINVTVQEFTCIYLFKNHLVNKHYIERFIVLKDPVHAKWWRPQNCPSHHQSAKTQSLDIETVSGMYVVILCGALLSVLLCVLQYLYGQLRRKRKLRHTKSKQSDPLRSQELGDEFRRTGYIPSSLDKQDKRDCNHDEITYANHSPVHYTASTDWN
ncbi:hypothetical protein Btru_065948 [Bulinus truncatus]|nr:hypothetical protein Btru_065948 [Bulinus truncatus]